MLTTHFHIFTPPFVSKDNFNLYPFAEVTIVTVAMTVLLNQVQTRSLTFLEALHAETTKRVKCFWFRGITNRF